MARCGSASIARVTKISTRVIRFSLPVKIILERHRRAWTPLRSIQLPFDVELDPVGVRVPNVVSEVPRDFSDDGRIRARAVLMKPSILGRHSPAARGMKILRSVEQGEYGIGSITTATELRRQREQTSRHG